MISKNWVILILTCQLKTLEDTTTLNFEIQKLIFQMTLSMFICIYIN